MSAICTEEGWHVRLTSREQVDALAFVMTRHPGPRPVYVHADGEMRRTSDGVSEAPEVGKMILKIFSDGPKFYEVI